MGKKKTIHFPKVYNDKFQWQVKFHVNGNHNLENDGIYYVGSIFYIKNDDVLLFTSGYLNSIELIKDLGRFIASVT